MVNDDHSVTVIDNNPEIINNINNSYDVRGICSTGTSLTDLIEADVQTTDLLIATTNSDEVNILACSIGYSLGAKHTVARIRDSHYTQKDLAYFKSNYNISMIINPELATATFLNNIIRLPKASRVETFSSTRLEMIELTIKDNWKYSGISIYDLRKICQPKFLVCAISRNEETFIPTGNSLVNSNDRIGLICNRQNITEIIKIFDDEKINVKTTMIIGGGQISTYLAKLIGKKGTLKIIEKDKSICEKIGEQLDDYVQIINGDASKLDFLEEQGLSNTDAFVCLTGNDESNILISYLANSKNDIKVLTEINNEDLLPAANNMGLDSIISQKTIVADIITSYARALNNSKGSNLESLYSLMNGFVKALEFNVNNDFKYCSTQIKSLQIIPNTIIAGIIRNNETIIPSGDDTIELNDKIIVITTNTKLLDLSDIIK